MLELQSIIPSESEIYDPKTKKQFRTVSTSYSIGNFRCAITELYSITVADLLYKLQEMRDAYSDGRAKSILEKIRTTQTDDPSLSKWEWDLINQVHRETDFIDSAAFVQLEHLYSLRCLCAHPAMDEDYELYVPSREETIAVILGITNSILSKPPLYLNKVVDMLTEDLAAREKAYANDNPGLKQFLDSRYFGRMTEAKKIQTAASLWKFIFVLDDDDCRKHREINRYALQILIEPIINAFCKDIQDNPKKYTVSGDIDCQLHLIGLMMHFRDIYRSVSDDVKRMIEACVKENTEGSMWVSWFLYDNEQDLFTTLLDSDVNDPNPSYLHKMYDRYTSTGLKTELMDFFIKKYSRSVNFNMADSRFGSYIAPFIKEYSGEQLKQIVEATDMNTQLYNRWGARSANTLIAKEVLLKCGKGFDFASFPNFHFREDLSEED